MKTVNLIVMNDDQFQSSGYAVYKNESEIREMIESTWGQDYRTKIDDETGEEIIVSGEEFFDEIQKEFMEKSYTETFNADLVPESGLFNTDEEYEAAKIK